MDKNEIQTFYKRLESLGLDKVENMLFQTEEFKQGGERKYAAKWRVSAREKRLRGEIKNHTIRVIVVLILFFVIVVASSLYFELSIVYSEAGLLLDIAGAFYLAKSLLLKHEAIKELSGTKMGFNLELREHFEMQGHGTRIGLVLLISGFVLQIIGNLIRV